MNPHSNIWRSLRWDFLLLVLLSAGLGIYWLLSTPYHRAAEEKHVDGSRPPDRTEGDILLLLPDAPSAEAKEFDELDCTYGWFNILWQEYGSFASALTRNLSPEILAGRSVVIVPRRVAESMPTTGVSALAGFVRNGGQLVIEQPGEGWMSLSGVSASTKKREAKSITSTEGLGVHGPTRKHLPSVPLLGTLQIAPQQEMWPSGPTLVEIDSQPGVLLREVGQGRVYTFLFDMGCTSTGLQQGLPTGKMRFGRGTETLIPTSARVADEKMRTTRVPFSDLLERSLLAHFSTARPIPKLWYYPGTYAGALLLSHPAAMNTRAAIGYADWNRKQEGTSTIFVAPDRINSAQTGLFEQAEADLGILWVRGQSRPPITRTIGIGALKPLAQELSLEEQIGAISRLLPAERGRIGLVHTEETLWGNDWSLTFEQMAAARIKMDTSFGPNGAEEFGYLFGTGFPFYPLDERGLPLPLLEQPFLLHEQSLTRERLERFLVNSRSYFHQPIAINLPAHAMERNPSAGALLGFRDALSMAKEHNHWVATQREFLEFLYARRQSVLTSQWSETTRRLTISVNLLGANSRTLEGGAIPGVAVPRTWRGEEIEKVILDGRELSPRELITSGPSTDKILAIDQQGRHTISVYYKTPEAPVPLE